MYFGYRVTQLATAKFDFSTDATAQHCGCSVICNFWLRTVYTVHNYAVLQQSL